MNEVMNEFVIEREKRRIPQSGCSCILPISKNEQYRESQNNCKESEVCSTSSTSSTVFNHYDIEIYGRLTYASNSEVMQAQSNDNFLNADYCLLRKKLCLNSQVFTSLNLSFPFFASPQKPTRTISHCWKTFIFSLLLITSTHANPISDNASFDNGVLSTTTPEMTQDLFLSRMSSNLKNNWSEGVHTRVLRSALLTPPSRSQKTSPQKRGLEEKNLHKDPLRLVTSNGFYVEIKKNGKVRGSRKETAYSVLEFTSISTGVVAIKGKKSGRYLGMDRKGKLVGLSTYAPQICDFHEGLLENKFFIFYQSMVIKRGKKKKPVNRRLYIAFDKKGKPKKGYKVQRNNSLAHFQKMRGISLGRRRSGKKSKRFRKGRRMRKGSRRMRTRKKGSKRMGSRRSRKMKRPS